MWQAGQSPVPGYKLEKFVGKGNFGEVWQASSPGGTKCAMKFLNLRERQGRKELRAIQRLKQIRHANLMPINAMWLLDDQQQIVPDDQLNTSHPFMEDTRRQTLVSVPQIPDEEKPRTLVIAMPLAESNLLELLHQRQKQGKDIPADELLVYMMDAARALDYLNAQCHEYAGEIVSVQHGDVKPENLVLLGGSVMLCDFGVARILGASSDTRGTTLGGSLAYMAPECMAGEVSQHSDQFSLAISYAELRTGNLPFSETSMTQVIEDRRKGQLDLEGLLPDEQRVIRRACSVKPDKRYGSNAELVEALRLAVLGSGTKSRKPGWLAAAAVAVILASVGSVALIFWQSPPLPDSPRPSVKTGPELFAEAMTIIREPRVSSEQLTQAIDIYSSALDVGFQAETPEPRRLGVLDNTTSEVYPIGILPRIGQLVAAHPRGGRILVVDQDGRSLIEPANDNDDIRYDLQLPSPIASVQWLDDTHLLIRDCDTTLWRVSLPSLEKEELATGILRSTTSPRGAVGIAAGDSPSSLYRIGLGEPQSTAYGNIVAPLIAMDVAGKWGVIFEEFEQQGTAGLLSVGLASGPVAELKVVAQIVTNIEPYCTTCLRIGEKCFAIVGGKSHDHPVGLALIPFPDTASSIPVDDSSIIFPSPTADKDLFLESGRVVRSVATHMSLDQSWGWLATGQVVGTGNALTELWKVLADGSVIYHDFIGQETQAESVSSLAFDPSGQWLVRGTSWGEVRLTKLDLPRQDFELMSEEYQSGVLQVQIIDGKVLATFDDASVLIWNLQECQMVFEACQQQKKRFPSPVFARPQAG